MWNVWGEKRVYIICIFFFKTESDSLWMVQHSNTSFYFNISQRKQNSGTPPACSSYVELSLTLVWTCECLTDDGSLYVKPDAKSFTRSEQRGVLVEVPHLPVNSKQMTDSYLISTQNKIIRILTQCQINIVWVTFQFLSAVIRMNTVFTDTTPLFLV